MKNSGPQKLIVAKLKEQNLEIPEIHQKLKDSRTMVHAKDVETQKFGTRPQHDKGRHDRLCDNKDDLEKELEKDEHKSKEAIGDMNKT